MWISRSLSLNCRDNGNFSPAVALVSKKQALMKYCSESLTSHRRRFECDTKRRVHGRRASVWKTIKTSNGSNLNASRPSVLMTDHQGKRKMKFSTQVGKVVAQRGLSANHQSRECACPSSWLVSHMPAGYETLPFPHNCLFVTSFPTARPATHQHQWFMTSFNQALVGHRKRERQNPPDTFASLSHLH